MPYNQSLQNGAVGIITSTMCAISLDDLNAIFTIAVQIIIGFVTIYRLLKNKTDGK